MLEVLLVFSAVAFTLNLVNSAHLFPHQQALLGTDHDQFLVKSFPYASSSPVWPKPDAEIQCGAKNMTVRISRLGSTPLHVNQNDSWLMVYQKPPQCSPTMSRHRRAIWPPPHGCNFLQPSGPDTFPVRVAGTPLVIGCPYPPRSPTVECTDGLQLRIGGVHAMSLKIKVGGYWYPLMTVCRWCQLTVELKGGEVSIKAPFTGPCTETKNGVHSLSIQSGNAEITFSCTPPPWPTFPPFPPYPGPFPPYPGPFPPYPGPLPPYPGHTHFPWPHLPHIHPPAPSPPFPWPVYPPPPKPLHPWHTIPYHAHPSPQLPTAQVIPMPWLGAMPAPAPIPWPGMIPLPPPSWSSKVKSQVSFIEKPDGSLGENGQQAVANGASSNGYKR